MKKIVQKVLLPLLFSFCFVFSGFLNVNASAADFSVYNGYNIYFSTYDLANSTMGRIFRSTDSHNFYYATTQYINGVHHFQNTAVEGANAVGIETSYRATGSANGEFFFPVNNDVYNYYIVGVMNSYYSPTFKPEWLQINLGKPDGSFLYTQYSVASGKLNLETNAVTTSMIGYSFSAKVDFSEYTGIRGIYLISNSSTISSSSIGDNVNFMASIVEIPKSASQEQVNSIIAAIQKSTADITGAIGDATDDITGSIGDAADDITGAIEDQYDGDPDSEFNVDDIISNHNDKMGVLSFGSDVMIQFLDMFQNTNPGAAQLTLPGFAITVQNVKYQVWEDQTFNFNQLQTWFPALINTIRLILPAFVWLMVLRYCIGVFERNFLSK